MGDGAERHFSAPAPMTAFESIQQTVVLGRAVIAVFNKRQIIVLHRCLAGYGLGSDSLGIGEPNFCWINSMSADALFALYPSDIKCLIYILLYMNIKTKFDSPTVTSAASRMMAKPAQ